MQLSVLMLISWGLVCHNSHLHILVSREGALVFDRPWFESCQFLVLRCCSSQINLLVCQFSYHENGFFCVKMKWNYVRGEYPLYRKALYILTPIHKATFKDSVAKEGLEFTTLCLTPLDLSTSQLFLHVLSLQLPIITLLNGLMERREVNASCKQHQVLLKTP